MKRDIIENQHIEMDGKEQSFAFTRDVISSTHFMKTGRNLGVKSSIDVRPFADQKAKKMNLSGFSFPVYIIRKPRQRSSKSDVEGGVKPPCHEIHAYK